MIRFTHRFRDQLYYFLSITFNERDDNDEKSAIPPAASFCQMFFLNGNMSRMLDSWIKGQMLSLQPRKQRHQGRELRIQLIIQL